MAIDMISLSADNKSLFLIEVKDDDSVDSLLKCILQIYTYFKIITPNTLIKDFDLTKYNPQVIPVIAIFKESEAHKQLSDDRFSNVLKLMKKLGVKVAELSGDIGSELDGSKISVEWWAGNDN